VALQRRTLGQRFTVDPDRTVGIDRADGGQRIDYGLEWSAYGATGGAASVFLGQSYRFSGSEDFAPGSGIEDSLSDLVGRFESLVGPRVLVVSLRAGGRGLNLPAANHVVHFDRWWNPAVEQQATDRVHRFGQRKHVYVTSLVCTATVEERIDELLDAKRELAEQVIAGRADDWLSELDLDTLRAAVALAPEAIRAARPAGLAGAPGGVRPYRRDQLERPGAAR